MKQINTKKDEEKEAARVAKELERKQEKEIAKAAKELDCKTKEQERETAKAVTELELPFPIVEIKQIEVETSDKTSYEIKLNEETNQIEMVEDGFTKFDEIEEFVEDSNLDKKSNQFQTNKKSVDFILNNTIYIEVHKGNLLQYISAGVIFPSEYSNQSAFTDPQTFEPSSLLLSNGQFSNGSIEYLLIEIASNALDESLIKKVSNYALYGGVIPISRIINIYAATAEIKKKIIDDALLRDSGLFPENLISVGFPDNLSKVDYVHINNNNRIDFTEKLRQYDKILGLISGSLNFSLLSFNKTQSFKSISDQTQYSLLAINNDLIIENDSQSDIVNYYKYLISKSCPDDLLLIKWIFNRVYNDNNFTETDTNEFERLCYESKAFTGEEKQIAIIFNSLKKSLERKKVFPEILKLQSKNAMALYVFSYLRNYGTRQNPELARIDITKTSPSKYTEFAFSILNFFFGYKQLRNFEDRITIDDKKVADSRVINSKSNLKFEMNSLLDYKIIDSVFNQVFYTVIQIKANDYSKYNTLNKKIEVSNKSIEGYRYNTAIYHGKIYESIIKISPIDELLPILNKLPNDIFLLSEFGLCCYRMGLKMNPFSFSEIFINPTSLKKMFTFSKNTMIDAIKDSKMDIDEIKQRIKFSQKHNEL